MKILVRGTNWIGDAVMSIPALRELRRIFPNDHIALHTRTWADGLFQDASFIDELITFDSNKWKIKDVYDNSQFLKGDGFELAVIFPNSFESAVTTFISRIPRRVGYNKDVRGLLLTDPVPVPEWKNRKHEVHYYLNLVSEVEKRVLGRDTVSTAEPDATLEISDERREAARELLVANGVDLLRPVIMLGPGSTNSQAKRWPAERFAALADMLVESLKANVVVLGSDKEVDVTSAVVDASKQRLIDLTGKTNVGEAAALLSVVDLMISNDMGLAHIAPSVGAKTIVIFGPTNPVTTRPFGRGAVVLSHKVDCAPCMLRDCPIDHRCMTRIEPETVFETARSLLLSEDEHD